MTDIRQRFLTKNPMTKTTFSAPDSNDNACPRKYFNNIINDFTKT